ncbi:MAG: hypothetical protein U0271_15195 [Polyangiaceae bacterium]
MKDLTKLKKPEQQLEALRDLATSPVPAAAAPIVALLVKRPNDEALQTAGLAALAAIGPGAISPILEADWEVDPALDAVFESADEAAVLAAVEAVLKRTALRPREAIIVYLRDNRPTLAAKLVEPLIALLTGPVSARKGLDVHLIRILAQIGAEAAVLPFAAILASAQSHPTARFQAARGLQKLGRWTEPVEAAFHGYLTTVPDTEPAVGEVLDALSQLSPTHAKPLAKRFLSSSNSYVKERAEAAAHG